RQGNHVGEMEYLLVKYLRIAVIAAEIDFAGVNENLGHTRVIGGDVRIGVAAPSRPQFIEYTGPKGVGPAERELGIVLVVRAFETSHRVECRNAATVGCGRVVRIEGLIHEKPAKDF